MSKKLKYTLIIIATLIAIYSLAWYIILNNIANNLQKEYGIKPLEPNTGYQSKFAFLNARPSGFPFKWAIALDEFYGIDSKNRKIEFKSPLIEGYDLLTQSLFVKYAGDINIKENADIINSRIEDIDGEFSLRMMLTPSLIKTLLAKNYNFLELINYIGLVKFNLKNLKWYNESKTEKYYDLHHITAELNFDKPIYYHNEVQLIEHLPENISFFQSIKFNENQALTVSEEFKDFTDILKRPFYNKIKINIKNKKLIEAELKEFIYEIPALTKNSMSGTFKLDHNNNYFYVDLKSQNEIGKNYFNFLKALFNNKNINAIAQNSTLFKEIKFILNHEKNFYLNEFENRKYNCEIKAELNNNINEKKLILENFHLSSGATAINLKNDSVHKSNKWQAKGILFLGNFSKLADLTSGYLLHFSEFSKIFDWSEESQQIVSKFSKIFLKSIADHPESTANDISISYDLDSNNLVKSKVGNIEFAQVEKLYYLALYKGVGHQIKLDDKIINKMIKLVPEIDQDNIISPDLIENIIKNPNKIFNKDILKLPK